MAIKPTPLKLSCSHCHWSTVYAPESDALLQPPLEKCPKCDHKLQSTAASTTELLLQPLRSLFS